MVRNFGEKRSKKKGKKSKAYKGPKDVKETEEVSSQKVAIYDPSEAKAEVKGSSRQKTYRSKRTERQRGKKDRSKDDWSNYDYTDNEEDEDDLDFGGEYDEIIRTGPARREAREVREAEQMASTSVTFINVGAPPPRNQEYGTSRRGRRGHLRHGGGRSRYGGNSGSGYSGYSGGGDSPDLVSMAEFSMIDLIMMTLADRFSI